MQLFSCCLGVSAGWLSSWYTAKNCNFQCWQLSLCIMAVHITGTSKDFLVWNIWVMLWNNVSKKRPQNLSLYFPFIVVQQHWSWTTVHFYAIIFFNGFLLNFLLQSFLVWASNCENKTHFCPCDNLHFTLSIMVLPVSLSDIHSEFACLGEVIQVFYQV
jgi:hypothetical protein